MKRTNVSFTEKQLGRLHVQAEQEEVAMAEVIRRAVEVYLVWNDPTYAPPPTPKKERLHPHGEKSGAFGGGGQ